MSKAVARHYEILDETIARHGGARPLEQGEGDSVVAAFARAPAAVACAKILTETEGTAKKLFDLFELAALAPAR